MGVGDNVSMCVVADVLVVVVGAQMIVVELYVLMQLGHGLNPMNCFEIVVRYWLAGAVAVVAKSQ